MTQARETQPDNPNSDPNSLNMSLLPYFFFCLMRKGQHYQSVKGSQLSWKESVSAEHVENRAGLGQKNNRKTRKDLCYLTSYCTPQPAGAPLPHAGSAQTAGAEVKPSDRPRLQLWLQRAHVSMSTLCIAGYGAVLDRLFFFISLVFSPRVILNSNC